MRRAHIAKFLYFGDNVTEPAKNTGYTKEKTKGAVHMAAVKMNLELFEKVYTQEQPVLVDFWAPWCGYCRRISTAYEKVADQNQDTMLVAKVNIDEEPELARREQIDVIPTLVLYRGGKRLGSITAPDSKAAIDAFIQQTLHP